MARPTKPSGLKELEGNRGKRRLNHREPEPENLNNLGAPAWLPPDAKAIWCELAPQLRKAQVLTVLDVIALEKLCVSVAAYRAATLAISAARPAPKEGQTGVALVQSEERVSMSPWTIVQSMSFKQAVILLREFGMTPAARARVMIEPQLPLFPRHDKPTEDQSRAAHYFN